MAVRIFTQILVCAQDYDLTDLDTVKDEIDLDDDEDEDDDFLERAITQKSTDIAAYCNRVFPLETVQDDVYIQGSMVPFSLPGGVFALNLSRFPVINLATLTQTLSDGTTSVLIEGTDFRLDYETGQLFRLSPLNNKQLVKWEALPLSAQYTAGYGKKTKQSANVPATPFQITVTNSAAWALDLGVTYADGTPLVAVASAPLVGQYVVNLGIYTFNAADEGAAVIIAYAYTSIPADLQEAVLELVSQRYSERGRDDFLVEETQPNLTTRKYWIGNAPGSDGAFPPHILGLFDRKYRVPVTA